MTDSEITSLIDEGFKTLSLKEPAENQKELLIEHLKLLLKWNKAKNLTAITNMRDAVIKHLLDSALLSGFDFKGKRILDIGTGGGFPGVPLAVLSPDSKIFLMEPVGKKCSFLRALKAELKIVNIEVYEGRAENFDVFIGKYGKVDFTTSRAFTDTKRFLKVSAPYLDYGGEALIFKGISEEPVECDGFRIGKTFEYELPFLGHRRKIVWYVKK